MTRHAIACLILPLALASLAGAADEPTLPKTALYRLGSPRLRHGGASVICCAFSPDGKVLCSVGNDDLGKIWDTATGKLLVELKGHAAGVQGCAFTPDGKHVLTCSMDNTLKLWEVATGKEVRTFTGHTDAVLPVAVSPDGKLAASEGQEGVVRIWELATGKELRTVPGHDSQGTTNLAFSPDSKHLVSVSGEDFSLVMWEAATGKEVRKFKGHNDDVNSLEFSADGKQLISASSDKTTKVWNVATGQLVKTFEGHEGMVSTARFCPDGKTMLSGSTDGSLRLWDLKTGKELRRYHGNRKTVSEVTVTPDNKIAATAGHDGTLRLYDIASGEELPQSGGLADWAAVSPDGKTIATGGGSVVRFFDAASGKSLAGKLDQGAAVARLEYADDKTLVVLGGDGKVKLWDVASGKLVREMKFAKEQPGEDPEARFLTFHSLGVSRGGKLVVAADQRGSLTWDGTTGKDLERPFQTDESRTDGFLGGLVLSADGRFAATMNNNNGQEAVVRIWDGVRGQELRSFRLTGSSGLERLTMSPDGRTLATSGGQPTFRLWETATGLERVRLPQPDSLATAVVVSADGRLAAAADDQEVIHVYDVPTGKKLREFTSHAEPVTSLRFLPGNKVLVSVSADATAIAWDLADLVKNLPDLPKKLDDKALDAAWGDLGGDDGVKANAAVWALTGAAEQALPLIKERLAKSDAGEDVKKIPELIKALDADEFLAREKATKQLLRLGRLAEPALREALQKPASLEVKLRIERVLDRLKSAGGTPDELRALRAVEVLDKVGGAEAKKVLESLADGPAEAVATREAKAALERWRQP